MSSATSVHGTYQELKSVLEEISHLKGTTALLEWDQLVMMSRKGNEARGKQMSTLAGVLHEKRTSPHLKQLLDILVPLQNDTSAPLNEWERAVIRDAKKSFDERTKIPKELVQREAKLSAEGYEIWVSARSENNFSKFAPVLKEWVKLRREESSYIDPSKPAYDVLLDNYERGLSSKRIDEVFTQVKSKLVPLIGAIKNKPSPDLSFLQHKFDVKIQTLLNHQISKELGFDTEAGRLDVSVHPFSTGIHVTDVRMTTRYKENDFIEGVTGTIHETGHSLYEQGRNLEYADLPVSEALSMGIHESQSLFWERMIGLSLPFWKLYWPKVKEHFSQIPKDVSAEKFYLAINKVEAGMIRIEADEVTYPMHIILRYELEKGLIEGTVEVDDLPKLWNAKMKEYLGIEPKTDSEGVLQDTHWSSGSIGYFPTYTLGAIYASQFYKQLEKEIPNVESLVEKGDFKPIKEWLRIKIHHKGSLIPSGDLLTKDVTGEPLNPSIFTDYLTQKFTKLYQLDK